MATGLWTIVYDGTEDTPAGWGILADFVIELVSRGKGSMTFYTQEAFDTAAGSCRFQVRQPGNVNHWIVVYQNRSGTLTPTGALSGSATGGSVYFAGWVARIQPDVEGARQRIRYTVYDIWWLMERNTFKQIRNVLASYNAGTGVRTYGSPYFATENYLFEYIPAVTGVPVSGPLFSPETTGIQISECLAWMNESYNSTRRGAAYYGSSSGIVLAHDIVNFWGCPGQSIWPPGGNVFNLPGGNWLTGGIGTATPNPVDATDVHTTGVSAYMDPQKFAAVTRVQNTSVADCIINALRWSPSVVVEKKYSTIVTSGGSMTKPVTLNFRDLSGTSDSHSMSTAYATNPLSLVTLNINSEQETDIEVRPEYERYLPGVVIEYKTANSINGQPVWTFSQDKFPLNLTGFEPEVLNQFVELAGVNANVQLLQTTIASEAITDATAASATRVAFWTRYEGLLINPNCVSDGFGGATPGNPLDYRALDAASFTVTDLTGVAVNTSTYPYVMKTAGQIPSWLIASNGAAFVDAIISIPLHYIQKNATGNTTHSAIRVVKARVRMTNMPSGTYNAASTSIGAGAEAAPPISTSTTVGLAEQLYNYVSTLGYSGTIKLQFGQLAGTTELASLVPGAPLKLTSPNNTYTNCYVHTVRVRPHMGDLEVEFGTVATPELSGLLELWRATHFRTAYDMPSGRADGSAGGAGKNTVDTSGDEALENTSSQPNDSDYIGLT